jgi:phosphoglycerate dehydrogenase-like enzyme
MGTPHSAEGTAPTRPAHSLVTDFPFDPPDRERLAAALAPGELITVASTAGELLDSAPQVTLPQALAAHPAATMLCTFRPPEDLLTLAPGIRWVQLASAGADGAVRAGLLQRAETRAGDLIITTANGVHAIPITEYVFSSILLWLRHWPRLLELQRASTWADRPTWLGLRSGELSGAALGIAGLGNIGRQVARLGRAFGMRTLGLRRSAQAGERDPDVDQLYPPAALHEMLAASDYVVLAVPRTPDTHHLIAEPELRAMRPAAYLVNIARGDVIDEQALICALREGWIGGAGLDVTEQEPLDADSPLWTLPNVILSPHLSGATARYSSRLTDLLLDNLARFRAGQPLRNRVDPARGY